MHLRQFTLFVCVLHVAFAAPQFVTFKDGKIGVNFGGYHADAGLGGLLTGNAAHGGLSASAGTPWGQQAAAGLNGLLNGRTSGVAYAGAQATPSVGASAVIGGTAGEKGFAGSEAHTDTHAVSKTSTSISKHHYGSVNTVTSGPELSPPPAATVHVDNTDNVIQKVKPPKKYTLIRERPVNTNDNANINVETNVAHSKHLIKSVHKPPFFPSVTANADAPSQTNLHLDTGVVGGILDIPIGILRSLQQSIGNLNIDKSVSLNKSV